ncbi:SEL1-like repeat protein [Calycomorphotria hydatis]|uniref:Beta-lactamase HcpC n=1 Tax=Calycomorphotria hydatis TaxID=2528027 RepID=A0A517T8K6_9PLAN|nr:SEL1-like repeat protein [Calycomorphotria hydatis]QDT64724.1 Putative beta-lactamase HcpC precursor [Calycomorphotria hydatis]
MIEVVSFCLLSLLSVEDIRQITKVDGNAIEFASIVGATVQAGDQVEVIVSIPGTNLTGTAAKGKVTGATDLTVTATLEEVTGALRVGQQVRVIHVVSTPPEAAPQSPVTASRTSTVSNEDTRDCWLATGMGEVTLQHAAEAGLNVPRGLCVEFLLYEPERPDEWFQIGDIVLAVNDSEFDPQHHWRLNLNQLIEMVNQNHRGEKMQFVIVRNQSQMDLNLKPLPKPALKEIFQLMKAQAKAGNAASQFNLAFRLLTGKGCEPNPQDAIEWFRKSAAQNHTPGIGYLGICYLIGQGVAIDRQQGQESLTLAAETGDPYFMTVLAAYLAQGKYLPQDLDASFQWYYRSALQNDPLAQREVAKVYLDAKEYDEARRWMRKAAELGDPDAQTHIGRWYYNGFQVPKDFSLAIEWFQKAADQGFAAAQNNLARCYQTGAGVTQDLEKALSLFRKAASQGDRIAQYNLGRTYDVGAGVQQDFTEAVHWYQLSADQGDPDAQFNLGLCHEYGRGTPQNKKKAFELFYKSAAQGSAEAQYRVGWAYAEANKWSDAVKWWQKAVDQKYELAQYSLGMNYLKGRGVARNTRKGIELLKAAANQGVKEASDELQKRGYRAP